MKNCSINKALEIAAKSKGKTLEKLEGKIGEEKTEELVNKGYILKQGETYSLTQKGEDSSYSMSFGVYKETSESATLKEASKELLGKIFHKN